MTDILDVLSRDMVILHRKIFSMGITQSERDEWMSMASCLDLFNAHLGPLSILENPICAMVFGFRSQELSNFALEMVHLVFGDGERALHDPEYLDSIESWPIRYRVFHYATPPTAETMVPVSPLVPPRPCWEQWFGLIDDELKWRAVGFSGFERVMPSEWVKESRALTEALQILLPQIASPVKKRSPGGDWRDQAIQKMWAAPDTLSSYAKMVDQLWSTWRFIKSNIFWKGEVDEEKRRDWVAKMWEDATIKAFAAKHSKFTQDLLARAVDYGEKEVNREPLALACFHAALEFKTSINGESISIVDLYLKCQRPEPSPSTLATYYKKGASLLTSSE